VSEPSPERPFASRGGHKLEHALAAFGIDVANAVCADLGCSTGGFTDCLLRRGVARVYAVDTAFGVLDYRLRTDERVTVMERTNALHAELPDPVRERGGVDLVTIDMSWTPQDKCIPAALRWLRDDAEAIGVLTLIKPHYEASGPLRERFGDRLVGGVLADDDAAAVLDATLATLPGLGVSVRGVERSPIRGGRGGKRKKHKNRGGATDRNGVDGGSGEGNVEYVAWVVRA
jgi:23S rRNA (cytidine1920-2'-O)/16S rRNA (cytidine1409-2'-O)-methyltransferase